MRDGAERKRFCLGTPPRRRLCNGSAPRDLSIASVPSFLFGLKQFDGVSRRVIQQDLRSARPTNNFIAEVQASFAQSRDLRFEIVHLELNSVPATGHGLQTVGHRTATGTGLPAEQEPHSVPCNGSKSWTGV